MTYSGVGTVPSHNELHQDETEKQPCRENIGVELVAITLALTMSIVDWFSAIRSPLWLDETNSYWSIAGGFSKIWSRQGLSFPAHSYILWLTSRLLGSSEVVLRLPSVIAMLAAVGVLYQIARRFFPRNIAALVTVIFCIDPNVAFAAIDARPYAFAVLMTNCAILALLLLMESNSKRHAILFGLASAGVFYFHYLFGVILAAFVCLIVVKKIREWNAFIKSLFIAFATFVVMMLPVLSKLVYLVETSQSHVYTLEPTFADVLRILNFGEVGPIFLGVAFLAIVIGGFAAPPDKSGDNIRIFLLLGAVPLTILYGVSTLTNIHVFLPRYTLVALPGLALCWGSLISWIRPTYLRVLFCVALMAFTFNELPLTARKTHGYSWKEALQVADTNAASDRAPLLIASGLIESDFEPLPKDVINSPMFSPLSYYRIHASVVPLPRDLNAAAQLQVKEFLSTAVPARQRFLVLIHGTDVPAMSTWISSVAKEHYQVRMIGIYDEVAVTEYIPR